MGTYTYGNTGAARPHAVASISGLLNTSYTYDLNGNMTSGAGKTTTWTAANMVATIVEGSNTVSFLYGSDNQRIKQSDSRGDTFYYSGAGIKVEKLVNGGQTTWHEYLSAGGGLVGEHFTKTGTVTDTYTYFFVTDHLGSVAVITDELGTVTERLSYDAWGKRRESDGDDSPIQIVSATTLGFTGHEMIDDVGLINMNGRIYDPTIGRFLSADPFIQDVTNSQNLNRYTYVNNNPLSYTDPSGFFFKKLFKGIKKIFKAVVKFIKKFWRPILAIAAAVLVAYYAPVVLGFGKAGAFFGVGGASLGFTQGAIVAGLSAGVSSIISTGKPKSFLLGFAQGFATYGIGHGLFNNAKGPFGFLGTKGPSGAIGKAIAHGVLGGAVSEVRGGKFSAGFLASGFSSLASPLAGKGLSFRGTVVSAVVGGVGSVLGGGKFANGAVNGSFTYLFNETAIKAYDFNMASGSGHVGILLANSSGGAVFIQDTGSGEVDIIEYGGTAFEVDGSGNLTEVGVQQALEWATPLLTRGNIETDVHITVFDGVDYVKGVGEALRIKNERAMVRTLRKYGINANGGGYDICYNNCGDLANQICQVSGCVGFSGTWRPIDQWHQENGGYGNNRR